MENVNILQISDSTDGYQTLWFKWRVCGFFQLLKASSELCTFLGLSNEHQNHLGSLCETSFLLLDLEYCKLVFLSFFLLKKENLPSDSLVIKNTEGLKKAYLSHSGISTERRVLVRHLTRATTYELKKTYICCVTSDMFSSSIE